VTTSSIVIDDLGDDEDPSQLVQGIRDGLLRTPREIAPRFFYDDRGAELFEQITALPEYYQTRTERALLAEIAADVCAQSGGSVLVELGSGSSAKTRLLLEAMRRHQGCDLYVPFDVNGQVVRQAAESLVASYPGLRVHGVIGDFLRLDHRLPVGGRRLVIFLGGTIGNLEPRAARDFVASLARSLHPGEAFLLGVDLIKDTRRLEAAYNDASGITAAFNRNILQVVNRVAQGDFRPECYRHLAFYDPAHHWIEMRLVATSAQKVRLGAARLDLALAREEFIRTEISVKYDPDMARELLLETGFELMQWYTDPEHLFGLALARRPGLSSTP